jgi:AbrB family looped-hinge helix DNA binding protein
MIAKTNIYPKYQTTIPKEIRKKLELKENQVIEWNINEKGNVELKFREKHSFKDMAGIFKTKQKTDAVEIKKKVQKGESF